MPAVNQLRFVAVGQDDPLAEPLLAELAVEYASRYGGTEDAVSKWLRGYPADGVRAAGRRAADRTARRPARHRRRVLPVRRRHRRAEAHLDRQPAPAPGPRARRCWSNWRREIAARGYRRVYLTTGDRQPEAEALYLSSGYTRLAEPLPAEGEVYPIAFVKALSMTEHLHLGGRARRLRLAPRGVAAHTGRSSPSPVAGTGPAWPPPPNAGCSTS